MNVNQSYGRYLEEVEAYRDSVASLRGDQNGWSRVFDRQLESLEKAYQNDINAAQIASREACGRYEQIAKALSSPSLRLANAVIPHKVRPSERARPFYDVLSEHNTLCCELERAIEEYQRTVVRQKKEGQATADALRARKEALERRAASRGAVLEESVQIDLLEGQRRRRSRISCMSIITAFVLMLLAFVGIVFG